MKNNLKKNINVYSTCFLTMALLGIGNMDNTSKLLDIKSPITVSHAAVKKDKYGVTIGGKSVNDGNTRIRLKKKTVARKGTSTKTASVRTLSKNSSVKVTHMTSSWARVKFSNGKTGWIPLSSGKVYIKTTMLEKANELFWDFAFWVNDTTDRILFPERYKARKKGSYLNLGIKYLNEQEYEECIIEFDPSTLPKIEPAPKGYKKPSSSKKKRSSSFTDIENHWAEGELEHYIDLGVISADSLDKVNPDRAITRGEFVSIVNEGFGLNLDMDNPDKNIERKEAVDMLINELNADVLGLESIDKEILGENILDVLFSTDTEVFETEEEADSAPVTKAQMAKLLYNILQKPTEEECVKKIITGKSVNFRVGPSMNDKVIQKLSNSTFVTVLDESNKNWTLVEYQGEEGYVSSKYLSEIDKIKTVTDNSVRFRKGPSTNAEIIENLNEGTVVSVLDESNGSWTKVNYRGEIGYVFSKYLI